MIFPSTEFCGTYPEVRAIRSTRHLDEGLVNSSSLGILCGVMETRFRFIPDCNDSPLARHAGSTDLLGPRHERAFPGETMAAKLGRALCGAHCLPVKEFFESVEFFVRVRKRLRARIVADLCCGHGLTGMLFALFEPHVERVILVDRARPLSHAPVLAALASLAPWVADKIEFRETPLQSCRRFLSRETSVVAIHACGLRTDACLDVAIDLGGAVAVVPCCYSRRNFTGSPALERALGIRTAFDIERTQRLEANGYHVRWDRVPASITEMSRILVATRRGAG